jgi:hypothetical protein
LTGQCKFDGNLFCFFLPPAKNEERNPTHIAHIAKAAYANAETKALSKSAIFLTLLNKWLINKDDFRSIKRSNLVTLLLIK